MNKENDLIIYYIVQDCPNPFAYREKKEAYDAKLNVEANLNKYVHVLKVVNYSAFEELENELNEVKKENEALNGAMVRLTNEIIALAKNK